jgi:hypothetical protein
MAETLTTINNKPIFRFKARIENGVIIPQETVALPTDQTYLVTIQLEPIPEVDAATPVDALAQLAALAQPLGPADLARHFDSYTNRIISDEPTD